MRYTTYSRAPLKAIPSLSASCMSLACIARSISLTRARRRRPAISRYVGRANR